MTGQMLQFIGYGLCGLSVLLLIILECVYRHNKKKIVNKVYDDFE